MKHTLADKIRLGEPVPAPLAALLGAATVVQRAGMWWKLRAPRTCAGVRVISFGNITAGGTGKTPAVIERVELELAAGRRVAVISRGYGGGRVAEPLVHPPHSRPDPARLGDEPALIAARCPGAWVVRSADRVAGAKAAIAAGCDTLILDDGYQAVALERDENVLVVDGANPFGNGRLLPRGILREPLRAMERATHVIITRCDQARDLPELERLLRGRCPGAPLRRTVHAPVEYRRLEDGAPLPLDAFRGQKARALCAIGHPEPFFRALEQLGVELAETTALPDHAPIPDALLAGNLPLIITEKDGVRVSPPPPKVYALRIGLMDWNPA